MLFFSERKQGTNGFYEVWVDYDWSGTVTPQKQLYTFDPISTNYFNVLHDHADQNYTAYNDNDLDCDGSIGWSDVYVMSWNWLGSGTGDIDNDGDVDLSDFSKFSLAW